MTVKEAMSKYSKTEVETRVYVKELETEECTSLYRYYDSEVLRIYPHNGDMVCEVADAR